MAITKSLAEHKNLVAFKQHGFVYKGESGTQVYGHSIFSGKDNFWINPETKMWDCKNTGIGGGYQRFIKEVHKLSLEYLKGDKFAWLRKNRGLMRNTLKSHNVGYNPHNETFLIPVYDANNDKIHDLRIFNPRTKKIIGTSGCNVGLYGWESLQKFKTIWLAEGEWDKMAMWEILYKNDKLRKELVVAVPGAGTFKSEWHGLFKDKIVNVVYDADKPQSIGGAMKPGAGPLGTMKVYKALRNIAKELKFVHWKKQGDVKDGYDLRDLLLETNHDKAYKLLHEYLDDEPTLEEEYRNEVIEIEKSDDEIFTGERVSTDEIYKKYKRWLYLPDKSVIDALYGALLANRFDGDPLWTFLIGPSGSGKSELILSVSEAPKIITTTSLTPQTLVSGYNYAGGVDSSLIPRLNGKNLLIKDFTTILNMRGEKREEIFSILRDAYDGKTEKEFGNGVTRSYKSIFGIFAGVTHAIELYLSGQTAFGERWLGYKITIPSTARGRRKYIEKAKENTKHKSVMRKQLSELGTRVLSYNYKKIAKMPDNIDSKIVTLAEWTSQMRWAVKRDLYSKEIIARPFTELGTRLVQQFTKFIDGVAMFKGITKITDDEYKLTKKLAVDSIDGDLNDIMQLLYNKGLDEWTEYKDIIIETELPSESCRRKIENLLMLKVIKSKKDGFKRFYSISREIYKSITEGEIYA